MRPLPLFAVFLAASAVFAAPASSEDAPREDTPGDAIIPSEQTAGEAKLAKMLDGRVAGDPEHCIRMFPSANLTIIDRTALVYKLGRTLFVNVPRNAARLDDRDILLTRLHGSRLCRTDIVSTLDQSSGMYTGNISLGYFIPYRKAPQDS